MKLLQSILLAKSLTNGQRFERDTEVEDHDSPDLNERFFSSFWTSTTDEQGKTIVDVNFNIKVDFESIGLAGEKSSQGCPGSIAFGTSSPPYDAWTILGFDIDDIECTNADSTSCSVSIDYDAQPAFLNTDGNCQSVVRLEVTPYPDVNGNRQAFDLSLFQTPASYIPVFNWVTDSGSVITETQPIQMKSEFKINSLNNHSPSCMVPPVWNILASCEEQYLDLVPYDLDGDIVTCRWADLSEVGLANYRQDQFGAITLDEHHCILHYRGSQDLATFGLRPIALMIEDFDDYGNLKSSSPVIFLAEIWTPTVTYVQISTEAPDTPATQDCPDGYHVDPNDCTSYFICLNNHVFPKQQCPSGLIFEGSENDHVLCNTPSNIEDYSNLGCSIDFASLGMDSGVAGECFDHPGDDEYSVGDCLSFYLCIGGNKYPTQTCPPPLFFDPTTGRCDWMSNVPCTPGQGEHHEEIELSEMEFEAEIGNHEENHNHDISIDNEVIQEIAMEVAADLTDTIASQVAGSIIHHIESDNMGSQQVVTGDQTGGMVNHGQQVVMGEHEEVMGGHVVVVNGGHGEMGEHEMVMGDHEVVMGGHEVVMNGQEMVMGGHGEMVMGGGEMVMGGHEVVMGGHGEMIMGEHEVVMGGHEMVMGDMTGHTVNENGEILDANGEIIGMVSMEGQMMTHSRKRRHDDVMIRHAAPLYCGIEYGPRWIEAPSSGEMIDGSSGSISFILTAISSSRVTQINYHGPRGLFCGSLTTIQNGEQTRTCTWDLTGEQQLISRHQICAQAVDEEGLQTERRCFQVSTSELFYTNIHEMAQAYLTGYSGTFTYAQGLNYGCAGQGHFDCQTPIAGGQIDEADKAFMRWKKCVQCAAGGPKSAVWKNPAAAVYSSHGAPDYSFMIKQQICEGDTDVAIDVCNCDYRLVTELQEMVPNVDSLSYNPLRCVKGHGHYQTECCKHNGIFDIINSLKSCCGVHGAQPAGTCTHEDF